jgi:hypothetical protein
MNTRASLFGFLLLSLLFSREVSAAQDVQTIWISDKMVAKIPVSPRGTVLSFPVKPQKAILGRQGTFGVEQIENDVAITALTGNARSHLFVYLEGRRFSFDLFLSDSSGRGIVLVRDESEKALSRELKWKTKPKLK